MSSRALAEYASTKKKQSVRKITTPPNAINSYHSVMALPPARNDVPAAIVIVPVPTKQNDKSHNCAASKYGGNVIMPTEIHQHNKTPSRYQAQPKKLNIHATTYSTVGIANMSIGSPLLVCGQNITLRTVVNDNHRSNTQKAKIGRPAAFHTHTFWLTTLPAPSPRFCTGIRRCSQRTASGHAPRSKGDAGPTRLR